MRQITSKNDWVFFCGAIYLRALPLIGICICRETSWYDLTFDVLWLSFCQNSWFRDGGLFKQSFPWYPMDISQGEEDCNDDILPHYLSSTVMILTYFTFQDRFCCQVPIVTTVQQISLFIPPLCSPYYLSLNV